MNAEKPHFRFTFTDLAAMIAVFTLAFCLLIPAVLASQEDSTRHSCENNLRMLGRAVHQFEEVNGHVPTLGTYRPPTRLDKHGWMMFLLPYIEQRELADRYRWDVDYCHPANQPVLTTQLRVVQCPATPRMTWSVTGSEDDVAYEAAVGDYAACNGVNKSLAAYLGFPDMNRGGMFFGEITPRGVRFADVNDGLSQTFLILEHAAKPDWYIFGEKQSAPIPAPIRAAWGHQYQFSILLRGHTPDGKDYYGPCAVNCSNDLGIYSLHSEVANALFADGSVQPLNAELQIEVMAALATTSGSEVLAPSGY